MAQTQAEDIEETRSAGSDRYERVVHDTPTGDGYLDIEGWTTTLSFENVDVPVFVVANSEKTKRIPLNRVQYAESVEPPESDLEEH